MNNHIVDTLQIPQNTPKELEPDDNDTCKCRTNYHSMDDNDKYSTCNIYYIYIVGLIVRMNITNGNEAQIIAWHTSV